MVDLDRLMAAYETARCDLMAETTADGHWTGQLSSSALSTATAISALAIVERHAPMAAGRIADERRECALSELVMGSVRWLARSQNADGGWGDTNKSDSNLATTLAVRAAFALTCTPANHPGLLERADAYIASQGGVKAFKKRYGHDKSLAAPILSNCALAGIVAWSQVPALPFELVCLPAKYSWLLRLPVVSFAIPALVAVGQARFYYQRPANPIARLVRRLTFDKSLALLDALQPQSGGFLEAVPLTAFVVMCLAATGRAEHPVVRKGVEFLLATVRCDGSWPIETNLALRNTALAIGTLASAGEDLRELTCLDWVLAAERHIQADTGAASTDATIGGWSWTDRPGGIVSAGDTSRALLALSAFHRADARQHTRILPAAAAGVRWLLDLQNADGGFPAFARGKSLLQDGSASDLTAHALRALHAWRTDLLGDENLAPSQRQQLDARIALALESGLRYLAATQQRDGAWIPLWFGNQNRPQQDNPLYGTTAVLFALRDLGRLDSSPIRRALDYLVSRQRTDGSFGASDATAGPASVEETALAVEALLTCEQAVAYESAAVRGLTWLIDAVEANHHTDSAAIGLFFDRLWYHERLYPLIMTTGALGQAVRKFLPANVPRAIAHFGSP